MSVMREREDMREELRIFATAPGGVIGRGAEDEVRPLGDEERRALLEDLRARKRSNTPGRVRRAG